MRGHHKVIAVTRPNSLPMTLLGFTGMLLAGIAVAHGQPARAPAGGSVATKPAPDSSGPQMAMPERSGAESESGVTKPPSNIDDGMKIPTPEAGSMPVIAPPGTPGGNQAVIPK